MRIEVITCCYNEEFLVPFFLGHYGFADRINVLLDADTRDRSAELLRENERVRIIPLRYPDGLDDLIKVAAINSLYAELQCDYVLIPDFDEFIFMDRDGLQLLPADQSIFTVNLYKIYRHVSEADLDCNALIKDQRRHGGNGCYKPIIVRGGIPSLQWTPGNHNINRPISDTGIIGAHWTMADPCFCVHRRAENRTNRNSAVNKKMGLGRHLNGVTMRDVLDECQAHENDPVVF
jgi:hypothetical protein